MKEGAKLVVDGGRSRPQGYEGGYFVGGSLFDGVTTDMTIWKEEIFGAGAVGGAGEDLRRGGGEMVAKARVRQRRGGLHPRRRRGAGLRARGRGRHGRGQRANPGADGVPLVGGWKASLFGDHHMHGPEGVRFYTRLKTITTRWPTGMRAEAEFVMPTMG